MSSMRIDSDSVPQDKLTDYKIKHAVILNIISRFSGFDPCWTNLEKCEYITQQT